MFKTKNEHLWRNPPPPFYINSSPTVPNAYTLNNIDDISDDTSVHHEAERLCSCILQHVVLCCSFIQSVELRLCFAQIPQQLPPSTMCLEFSVESLAKYTSYNLGPISENRIHKNSVYVKPEMRETMFSISQSQLSLT